MLAAWGNVVADTMLAAGCLQVMVVPMTFVNEERGCIIKCHGGDFLSCGSAETMGHLGEVLMEKFGAKVLPRVIPPTEAASRTHRHVGVRGLQAGGQPEAQRGPRGAHRHQGDLEGADVPISETTGKVARDILDDIDPTEASLLRQGAGAGVRL